jgi:hypothetical protein
MAVCAATALPRKTEVVLGKGLHVPRMHSDYAAASFPTPRRSKAA